MTYSDLITRHNIKPWLGILPGYDWLQENEHRLDDYHPAVQVAGPGFKHTMTVRPGQKGVMSAVMKVNR